jgi:hypothetical protein
VFITQDAYLRATLQSDIAKTSMPASVCDRAGQVSFCSSNENSFAVPLCCKGELETDKPRGRHARKTDQTL